MTAAEQAATEAFLPRPPGAIRRWIAAHPAAIDITILVCYLLGAVPLSFLGITVYHYDQAAENPLFTAGYTLVVGLRLAAVTFALLYRRQSPVIGLTIVMATLIGDGGPTIIANSIASWFLLYAVPVYRDVRTGWIAYGIVGVGTLVSIYIGPLIEPFTDFTSTTAPIASFILNMIWALVILLIGINLGNRRRYLAAIIDRAHQLARERDQLAQLAVAEERSRIAREIHDIVAHSVSVMIALSEGGARAIQTAPEAAANAMERSAETGRAALTEMRRLLGALQVSESAEMAPQPSVSDIPALVRGFEDAGLHVTLSDAGVDRGDRLQGLAIYRVVQEGLTNVLRYAGEGARVEVTLARTPRGSEVTVRDYGRPANTVGPTTGLGSGRGLHGLAERVRVFGGTIESGPVQGGPGWQLHALFPDGAARHSEER